MIKSTGMIVDGIFASEAVDSSGEIVKIDGMDITVMERGEGVLNYEHLDEDQIQDMQRKGKAVPCGSEVVGRILFVKKIFSEEDCEDSRQLDYFKKINGIPFLYGIARLYDGAEHAGAKELAAMMRDHRANQEPINLRYSIEGATLERNGSVITRSIAKKTALTNGPCNKTCVSGIIYDPNAPAGFEKSNRSLEFYEKLEKKRTLLASISKLNKTLSAGSTAAAPGNLVQGAALQRSVELIKNWDKKTDLVKYLMDKGLSKADAETVFHQYQKANQLMDIRKDDPEATVTQQEMGADILPRLRFDGRVLSTPFGEFEMKLPDLNLIKSKCLPFLDKFQAGLGMVQECREEAFQHICSVISSISGCYHPDFAPMYSKFLESQDFSSMLLEAIKEESPLRAVPIKYLKYGLAMAGGQFLDDAVLVDLFDIDNTVLKHIWSISNGDVVLGIEQVYPGGLLESVSHYLASPSQEQKLVWAMVRPKLDLQKNLGELTSPLNVSYIQDYGLVPALILYFSYIVPKLNDLAKQNQEIRQGMFFAKSINVIEKEVLELRKNLSTQPQIPEINSVKVDGREVGRFMVQDNQVHILEDNFGIVSELFPEGPVTVSHISRLHAADLSPHIEVQKYGFESAPEIQQVEPQRPGIFDYCRGGKISTLEMFEGKLALDGKELDKAETELVLSNIRNGLAKISYKKSNYNPNGLAKKAWELGQISSGMAKAIEDGINTDPATGLKNRYALNQFLQEKRPGVFAVVDFNDLKEVNSRFGVAQGDQAIKYGFKSLNQPGVEVFRDGGQAVIWAPSAEHLALFIRKCDTSLQKSPLVGGAYRPSVCCGCGESLKKARLNLMKAKQARTKDGARMFAVGKVPTIVKGLDVA